MVSQNDVNHLMRQMRAALINKPITEEMKTGAAELQELQEAMEYLSACLHESNMFLRDLCAGRLNADPPGRHNFIAGQLKELHSILKHLTWQTAQVANGDYSQKVHFLGEFSDSFNIMIRQLKEREISLSAKSNALTQSMSLLKSVLDGQRDWVVVTDTQHNSVIYANLSAKRKFYAFEKQMVLHQCYEELLARLLTKDGMSGEMEFACKEKQTLLLVRSFPIEWNERQASVHCISDVTDEREEKEQLHNMAYKDTLTNAYNRRYCVEKMSSLMEKGVLFSLVLLDLDGLKIVNDAQGHNQGDEYITTVAGTVMDFSRTDDRLCRIGGDEFVLILPECSEKNAEKKMARICAELDSLDKPFPISISYGIISVGGECTASPEELFSLADIRMYAMKKKHKTIR